MFLFHKVGRIIPCEPSDMCWHVVEGQTVDVKLLAVVTPGKQKCRRNEWQARAARELIVPHVCTVWSVLSCMYTSAIQQTPESGKVQ
jgi:hypothetical protein